MKSDFPSMNREEYRDKVYGCWCGKAAGGTLGAPYEWKTQFNHAKKYPPSIKGASLPNDDLDLQLIWLLAVEKYGALNVNERILAEYWSDLVTGPWNEYGVCRNNIRLGLMPPLSGSCCNDRWKWSNGAWIRSEIWACLFPGAPDYAVRAAYADACCDHCGEGIFAELFTAAMESAAFVEKDTTGLIETGLSFIPEDCRIAQTVRLARKCRALKLTLEEARSIIVKETSDLGWFQAPGNVGFMVLGLLYGEGDFGKSIASAVNCGDDADCTGGTAGAVLGIISGRSGIPDEWLDPIGDGIVTCAVDNVCRTCPGGIPRTLAELTGRVVRCAELASMQDRGLMRFTDGKSELPEKLSMSEDRKIFHGRFMEQKHPFEMTFDMPWGWLALKFENGPFIEPGRQLRMTLRGGMNTSELALLRVRFSVPEGWTAGSAVFCPRESCCEAAITPGASADPVVYVRMEILLSGRMLPYTAAFPLLRKDAVHLNDRDSSMMLDHFRTF